MGINIPRGIALVLQWTVRRVWWLLVHLPGAVYDFLVKSMI